MRQGKRMKKKTTILLLAGSLMIAGIAALLYQSQNSRNQIRHYTAFFSTTGEEITSDNDMKKKIAEQIGADCEETWLKGQTKDNALNAYIAAGEYPDFISGESKLYDAGALIPIDEYWDNYPNIKNYLTEEQWDLFRQADGHIYWIPQFGVSQGQDTEVIHSGEAFWIQTRVLKWADYPEITTVDEYFDLLERYQEANPCLENGTPNIPFAILCDDWRYFCLENVPQFLDGYPNDGSCIVDPDTLQVIDYNTTPTAKRYYQKLNEEYKKGMISPETFLDTYEEYLEDRLSPTGLTLDELKEHGMMPAKHIMPARTTEDIMKVHTPTGKIEFVSTILKACKKEWHEGVPAYHDFRETLPMKEYPLILSTGSRKPQLFHSRTYRLPWLVNLEDCPIVELHPEDAENYSVKTGEMVTLETPVGQMDMEAVVNSSCLQGAVNVYHGAGNYDINLLIDDQYIDPISGFPGFKSYCCRIVKKGA